MSSIGAVSGNAVQASQQQANQPPRRVDPDHDGDNDKHASKANEAAEASKHKVNVKA